MALGVPTAVAFLAVEHWLWGTWALGAVARGHSSPGSWALEHSLNSCDPWAYLLRSMWDPPGSGMEPVSPALADRLSLSQQGSYVL